VVEIGRQVEYDGNMSKRKKAKKKADLALIGLAVFFLLLICFVKMAEKKNGAIEKFFNGSLPENVRISNLTNSSFAVSWLTKRKVDGSLLYGKKGFSLVEVFDDRVVRGRKSNGFYTHHVTASGLEADSEYVFKIKSGKKVFDGKDSKQAFEARTLREGAGEDKGGCPVVLWGNVVGKDLKDLVVYATGSFPGLISVITDDRGFFRLDFSKNGIYCPAKGEKISLVFEGGKNGVYFKEVTAQEEENLANIVLEKKASAN